MARLRQLAAVWLVGIFSCLLLHLSGCGESSPSVSSPRLTIGLVSYDAGPAVVDRYAPFQRYLAEQLKTVVELEPAYNELRAVEQIQKRAWSLVFAPSGLTAIAINEGQYIPLFPLQGTPNQRSVLVVRADSELETIADLANRVIALGEPGSATGYYLPLYDLFGLTLSEIRFAPTPRTILEWLESDEIAAGALSETDYQRYRGEFASAQFRVLHQSRVIPPGAVLLSPTVERNQQQLIEQAMRSAPSNIAADAGYVANAQLPTFDQLIQLVSKVRPLEAQVKEQPAVLTLETTEAVGE
ncbi:phosphonate ABC transporter substrate-binding protein [filamentous cyanobacterium CCP5]|nr:phosphonate ABC transporter substrate-binding protein [filamentous cyanobacterium CCP5]